MVETPFSANASSLKVLWVCTSKAFLSLVSISGLVFLLIVRWTLLLLGIDFRCLSLPEFLVKNKRQYVLFSQQQSSSLKKWVK